MKTLFIDTHYKDIIIAIFDDNKLVSNVELKNVANTSVDVMPSIVKCLDDANINIKEIKKVAVCVGPGSFTGVRLGVTIAKVLAYSLNIDIVSLTAFDIVSLNLSSPKYIAIKENNGMFIAYFDGIDNKDIKYLKNSEFDQFKTSKDIAYEDEINYERLIEFINTLSVLNVHNVNPLYVKTIEALNDKKN